MTSGKVKVTIIKRFVYRFMHAFKLIQNISKISKLNRFQMAFHRFVEFIFKKDEKKAILQNKSNEQF